MTAHRILITGSRSWKDKQVIQNAILSALQEFPIEDDVTVVHGGAHGADTIAGEVAENWGIPVEVHEADWRSHGVFNAGAGKARNKKMVELGADLCLAFQKGTSGTADCIEQARNAGIEVRVFGEYS